MKNPHTNETEYLRYTFTDIDGVKFEAFFRSPQSVKRMRRLHRNHCIKFNRNDTIRYALHYWGWVNKIVTLQKRG